MVSSAWRPSGKNGSPQKIPTVGDYSANMAEAINARGEVVGTIFTPQECSDALLETMRPLYLRQRINALRTPTEIRSEQIALLSSLAAHSDNPSVMQSLPHGYVYRDGKSVDLNDCLVGGSGWTIVFATGINDRGDITALGIKGQQVRALVLTPQ